MLLLLGCGGAEPKKATTAERKRRKPKKDGGMLLIRWRGWERGLQSGVGEGVQWVAVARMRRGWSTVCPGSPRLGFVHTLRASERKKPTLLTVPASRGTTALLLDTGHAAPSSWRLGAGG